jgi:hypothetical protein
MKCVQNPQTKEIKRVSDTIATDLAAKGWVFVGKQTWKKLVRDVKVEKKVEEPKADESAKEKPKKAKGNPKGKAKKQAEA